MEHSGIPFGPVNNISSTFDHPQVKHRKMIQTVDHPTAGPINLVGLPVKYSETPGSIRLPPPTLGQHTTEVLQELCGYDSKTIEGLIQEGVVRDQS